jgi:hypothetical protein
MNDDERWIDFRYQYIETGWFDYDRSQTIEAMQKLAELIPDDVLESLPPLVVFAPSAAKLGEVKPFGLGDRLLIYLSPRLEALAQEEVDFTVAHEFAHVALGHYKSVVGTIPHDAVWEKHEDAPTERDTDHLIESWGVARPEASARAKRRKNSMRTKGAEGA